ncbi:MAG: hypothetical protein QNJ55_19725 [Xenococcus sp. MO_188.B8]|nr:hypothetical protein [Xenococcus sp. MO_188.B8]
MSEEKTQQMAVSICQRIRNYFIFTAIVLIFLIWSGEISNLITTKLFSTTKDDVEIAAKVTETIFVMVAAFALIILNFGRDIDLHNFIDENTFRTRHKVGKIIYKEMISLAELLNAPGQAKMTDKRKEVMRLFYHFVNNQSNQEKLRSLAFTYWEQYFVNLYIMFFCVIGFLCSLAVVIVQRKLQMISLSPLFFLIIGLTVWLRTKSSLLKRIYDLPRNQIGEIRFSNAEEFKEQVKKRFGDQIINS